MTSAAETLRTAVIRRLAEFTDGRTIERLWDRDPSVWGGDASTPELTDRLGWLTVGAPMGREVEPLRAFADDVRQDFDRIVLLGMGGSSLAPEVLWRTFGRKEGFPVFQMLDSTAPDAVQSVDGGGDLSRTLFIVASKSGTTVETMSFFQYFWDRTRGNGNQFVAITDPDMSLERLGRERGFKRVFLNPADIGGRYSALSLFGLVPAALLGIDVATLLQRAEGMANQCAPTPGAPEIDNPGAALGVLMAEAALAGRDKLTFVMSPGVESFGLWAEQLIAESTGKEGKGIIPVVSEPASARPRYCEDRLFVGLSLQGDSSEAFDNRLHAIEAAGYPLARIALSDPYDVGAEFFRWEFATAVAGAVLGVNPFDQPNVAESKQSTMRALSGTDIPRRLSGPRRSRVVSFLDGVRPGNYVSVQAYLAPTAENDSLLASLCAALRDRVEAAVTVGYGPRYLHSTGQLHKGGPPIGHFIQVMDPLVDDVAIPNAEYGFGQLLAAQAQGDFEALTARELPVVRVSDPTDLMELM